MAEPNNPYQEKIDNDTKNLVQLKAGTANQQLINAAYLGARQEPPAVMTWMNAAESGLTSFTEAVDKSKKARQAKLDEMNGKIDEQIDNLTTTGFSLGKTYYSAASQYTKGLREEYLAAEGNPERQSEIKMELNLASQNISGAKKAIEDIAVAFGPDAENSTLERSALNPAELDIIDTVTNDANAIWDYEQNTFVWQDPKDPEKTYTIKDIQDIQKIASKDYEGQKNYIEDETKIGDLGNEYKNGKGGSAFNANTQTHSNLKRITKDNIRFYIHGDFTGDGTPSFKDEIINHPDMKWDGKIFKHLTGVTNENGDMIYDIDGDGDVDIDDFGDVNNESRVKIMSDVYTAITDDMSMGYDYDVTRGLIAEYMTLRQEKRFYGGKTTAQLDEINPEDYDNTQDYIDAGGNIGYAKEVMGYSWGEKLDRKGRSYTPPRFDWKIDASKGYKAKFGGTKY